MLVVVGGWVAGQAAPAAAAPSAGVVPADDVVDDQVVTVEWSGYPASTGMEVRICRSQVFDVEQDCTDTFGGATDLHGVGRQQIKVQVGLQRAAASDAQAKPPIVVEFLCGADDPCAIRVDSEPSTSPQLVPISFASSTRPRRTCEDASPNLLLTSLGAAGMTDAFERWIRDLCQVPYGVAVDFSPRSSGEGRDAVIKKLADVGVSAQPFTDRQLAELKEQGRDGQFVYIPIAASGITVIVNAWHKAVDTDGDPTFQQIRDLCLSAESAARALTGQFTYLYESESENPRETARQLVNDNPFTLGVIKDDPRRPLQVPTQVMARGDASYSTLLLTQWFQSQPEGVDAWDDAGPEFAAVQATAIYPSSGHIDSRSGSVPVMRLLKSPLGDSAPGLDLVPGRATFGWADLTLARSYGLPVASLKDPATGNCIAPTPESITQGIAAMTPNPDGVTRSPVVATGAKTLLQAGASTNAYPMPVIYYLIVPTSGLEAGKVPVVKQVVDYILGAGQQGLSELGYAPLPDDVMKLAQEQAAKLPATAAAATPPAATTSGAPLSAGGTFDNQLLAATPFGSPVPLAAATETPAAAADDEGVGSSFVRLVTSPGGLPILLVVLLGTAAVVAGPILRRRAARAGN